MGAISTRLRRTSKRNFKKIPEPWETNNGSAKKGTRVVGLLSLRFEKCFPRKAKGELETILVTSSFDWYAACSISFLILLAATIACGFYFIADALEVTPAPTLAPTTQFPSAAPTPVPINITHHTTSAPTRSPLPTAAPSSNSPTSLPTHKPSNFPTFQPTHIPTFQPTHIPTFQPTHIPTIQPTHIPTFQPTHIPTLIPTPIGCNATCLVSCEDQCTVKYLMKAYGDECEFVCAPGYNRAMCVLCYRRLMQDCMLGCHKSCDC